MIDEIIKSGNFKLVSNKVYNKRIAKCSECVYLDYNTNCTQCGCIVQVRALLEDKNCPCPKNSRW